MKRRENFRKEKIILWLFLICFFVIVFFTKLLWASDYHQKGETHEVVYTIVDTSGNPVSGQTVRLQVVRVSDDYALDFSDGTFKNSGWTTRLATMPYHSRGEFYGYTITIDSSRLVSGDYVCVISNDDTTYGDQQAETISFSNLGELIRMHR